MDQLGVRPPVLPHGIELPLSAKVLFVPHLRVDREGEIHGRGHPKRDAVGWLIPILWPVKVITLPARGPRPTLKGEVRITLRLLDDVEVPPAVTAPRTNSWIPRPTDSSTPPRDQEQVLAQGYLAEHTSVPQITLLILKDGTGYLASDYWFESGQLHYVNANGQYKLLPPGRLDLEETLKLNRERNVEFTMRSRDASQH